MLFKLRPQEILTFYKIPLEVCICETHADFSFLVKGLLPYLDNSICSYKDISVEACCNVLNEQCMLDQCMKCEDFNVRGLVKLFMNREKQIVVHKWQKENGVYKVVSDSESINYYLEYLTKTTSVIFHFVLYFATNFLRNRAPA